MAIEPAAISARPAVPTMPLEATAPLKPAASANGTVSPSDIPMTTSRTVSLAVKWRSVWIVRGICNAHYARWGGSARVDVGAVADVGDELLHVERLRVYHVDGILQAPPHFTRGHGRGKNGVAQQPRLMLAHVRQHREAIGARHHQIE